MGVESGEQRREGEGRGRNTRRVAGKLISKSPFCCFVFIMRVAVSIAESNSGLVVVLKSFNSWSYRSNIAPCDSIADWGE